ncbi:MAG: maleylpyruvate isomerase N-terminal domain-containing protein [Acidimicrobiales bacterium]
MGQTVGGSLVLSVDALSGYSAGLDQLPVALCALRGRMSAFATGLEASAWDHRTRCELWTVHDVLRHVRDCCRVRVDGLGRNGPSPLDEPFDARATPVRWLAPSDGETPDETVAELQGLVAEEAPALRWRLRDDDGEVVSGPYGPVHWTVLSSHVFWDPWLHERDIAGPLGVEVRPTAEEEAVIALDSLLIASVAAARREPDFSATVALIGEGGWYSAVLSPPRVSLRPAGGPGDEDLAGELVAVVDALVGRGDDVRGVLTGSTQVVEPLTTLRAILRPRPATPP